MMGMGGGLVLPKAGVLDIVDSPRNTLYPLKSGCRMRRGGGRGRRREGKGYCSWYAK